MRLCSRSQATVRAGCSSLLKLVRAWIIKDKVAVGQIWDFYTRKTNICAVSFALGPGLHTRGKRDWGGVGRAAHTGASTCLPAADAAGIPAGMRQVGWRNSAVGASTHHVPGDPRGLEISSARARFYRWIEDGCVKGNPAVEHGPSSRTGSAFPSVPGCLAGAAGFWCDHGGRARSYAWESLSAWGEALLAALAA